MTIDNKITLSRIKSALSIKIIVIVLLIAALVATVFYVTIENREKKEILIWYVTSESEDCFSKDVLKLVNDYGAKVGIEKVVLTKRNPDDTYFDVAMTTSAYYNCDVFIMTDEMAKQYAEMDMFLPLQTDRADGEDLLYIGDDAVGVLINENYYLLINAKTDVDLQIIYDIFDIFTRTT